MKMFSLIRKKSQVQIKNYCRDFGVDANELATLAMRFLEEEYKDKKKSA